MYSEFTTSVEYGLKLSKRIYYGKEMAPPALIWSMSRSSSAKDHVPETSYLPTAVTAYAVVPEPEIVDNPDVPSYQPYVHGRCEPPALIPLHLYGVDLEVECWLDHACVSFHGTWRLHCVKASRDSDCCIVVPLRYWGSLLGAEVHVNGRTYKSSLIMTEVAKDKGKSSAGGYIRGDLYSFKIPQIPGGSKISVRVSWSQKLEFHEGQFCLNIPFTFPAFVNPIGKGVSKREKIVLNVNSGVGKEILCKSTNHSLMETSSEVGKMGFQYEAEVPNWSSSDFDFSYTVSSEDMFGGVLVQSPALRDFDDGQMLCLYLFPGSDQNTKIFRKEVVFLIDVSGSMREGSLESVKNAVLASLSKLSSQDSFNIIAFNDENFLFSPSMEAATKEGVAKASKWLTDKLIADGGTNIFLPLKQAMNMLKETTDAIPLIILITDGSVQDERDISNFTKDSITNGLSSISTRIYTFGIGTYCNHYFLKMLAQIGRGYYDSAYDLDSLGFRLQRLLTTALSINISNVTLQSLESDALELYPSSIPDLSTGSPLIVSGRYGGNIPNSVVIRGILAGMSNFTMDLEVRKTKDAPLDRVFARRQIDTLTANAWLSKSEELEQKVAKMSIRTMTPSEYTQMILLQIQTGEEVQEVISVLEVLNKMSPLKKVNSSAEKVIVLGGMGTGFGNLDATAKNFPPGKEEPKSLEATEKLVKAASNCCSRMLDRFCCRCCIKTLYCVNGQCYIVLSQLCAALSCLECLNCCYELCEFL